MKPLLSETEDIEELQALGRASVQIVHDLKNQLNGLKLYATFLRRRLEKSERPADELETTVKLIAGLDRAAADLSMIADYGRPLDLKKRAGTDLDEIMRGVALSINDSPRTSGSLTGLMIIDSEGSPLFGEFDALTLSNALKSISLGAIKMINAKGQQESMTVRLKHEKNGTRAEGIIEWPVQFLDHDPFESFAGTDEIRMALAAKVIAAHGGSTDRQDAMLRVRLPLAH
jgi:signal transduction histidine kinase